MVSPQLHTKGGSILSWECQSRNNTVSERTAELEFSRPELSPPTTVYPFPTSSAWTQETGREDVTGKETQAANPPNQFSPLASHDGSRPIVSSQTKRIEHILFNQFPSLASTSASGIRFESYYTPHTDSMPMTMSHADDSSVADSWTPHFMTQQRTLHPLADFSVEITTIPHQESHPCAIKQCHYVQLHHDIAFDTTQSESFDNPADEAPQSDLLPGDSSDGSCHKIAKGVLIISDFKQARHYYAEESCSSSCLGMRTKTQDQTIRKSLCVPRCNRGVAQPANSEDHVWRSGFRNQTVDAASRSCQKVESTIPTSGPHLPNRNPGRHSHLISQRQAPLHSGPVESRRTRLYTSQRKSFNLASQPNLQSHPSDFHAQTRISKLKRIDKGLNESPGIGLGIVFKIFTPNDSSTILSGVAPSGSNKTSVRREKEAQEKSRRLSLAAIRAVEAAGGITEGLFDLKVLLV